ncbi:glucokinase [Roseiarcaceae bacterium H3SJ34-1]|uniref:glucokinase n=1 Tax=Terripilifer ovatus TaxID=3032367 RepID=UPI003AB99742|nr:glucokinase [Roseiarcaceae bacterium H3SJ34-1]
MARFPFPLLVCDIGGTNMRFSHVERPGEAPLAVESLATAAWPGLAEAAVHVIRRHGFDIRSFVACGAGPVAGKGLHLTNAAWAIDGPALADRLGLQQGLLLNDFEALAFTLPTIEPDEVRPIGRYAALPGTRIVLGPGTGLGVAALTASAGGYLVVPGEAGHIDFGPQTPEEAAFWPHIDPGLGRVSAEWLLSGPGLARLHRARLAAAGLVPDALDAAAIAAQAGADRNSAAAATLRLFWRLVARFAGDMALTFLARGGVTLAGGVLPKITDFLDEAVFRAIFEAKAPMQPLLQAMPVRILMEEHAVARGMAAIAANPDAYSIDYAARCWR